ncbi:hybrid sensor histidine kinase/response regulator [Aquincola sp. MAHUQ-54]|uniref:histidine kinase n=1 Tax=Aquincola agrisoli TaxID=3119538 RepID=A0AAW9QFA2_9BURK
MTPPRPEPRDEVNLLVVDDVAQNLIAMQALLARPGLRVLTARSGAEALELLLAHDVALALLDVQMPEMDGFELAELMRGAERTRSVPIIFLTAAPRDGQRSFRGYEAGAVDFLYKPIDPEVLSSKVAVFVELFEQRQALRDSLDQLQRVLALNEAMVAVLTHDLRTPLQAMLAGAELIRRKSADADARHAAEGIRSSGQRMSRMITQLLDFSRIRSGSLQLDKAHADLGVLCAAVLEEVRQARPQTRIELSMQGDLTGSFDADRLMQVIANLVTNAAQHGRADEPISVRLDGTHPAQLVAEVSNAGELPQAVQARLFEPFRERSASSGGLGLGLYIVAQFMQAHGGEVDGRSGGDGRTVFRFTLPRGQTVAAVA